MERLEQLTGEQENGESGKATDTGGKENGETRGLERLEEERKQYTEDGETERQVRVAITSEK